MSVLNQMRGDLFVTQAIESTGNAASTGNLPVWRAPYDCTVTAVALNPSAAITADATHYAVYTLTRHTAGASATTVATRSWAATNSVAVTPESMTLSGTAANLILTAGDTIDMVKTVGGNGLVIPNMLVVVTYRWNGV
jgi:hypothetical protein